MGHFLPHRGCLVRWPSSSLSLLHRASFTPTPHGSVVPEVGPPQHCTSAVPHNPHPHTPLSSLRAVTHPMCCFIPCWCVHTNGTVFCFLSAVFLLWFAALPTLPPLCVAVLCAVPCVKMSVLPCVHLGLSCAHTPAPSRLPRFVCPCVPAL